jgi:uncharacterized delta-60 repeat protein
VRNSSRETTHPSGVRLAPTNPRRNRNGFQASAGRQLLAVLIAALIVGASSLVRVKAAEGDLDITFGTDGKVTTHFGGLGAFDGASAVAIQGDGKIVAAGFADDSDFHQILALVRYETTGGLDPTFGTNGKVPIDFANASLRVDVAIQNDGKIIVVGTVGAPGVPTDFGIARYDTNGNPDPMFGIGGEVTTDFFGDSDEAASVAIQSDGKIVVAGMARGLGTARSDFALVRYEANGDPDATFGVNGMVTTDFFGEEDRANGVAIQSDGKIVAVGSAAPDPTFRRDFAVARYNTDGTLDVSFDADGKATTDVSDRDEASSVAIQPGDGKIVVVGGVIVPNNVGSFTDFAIMRYETSGGLDPAFGSGGQVITDFLGAGDYANDVVIQSDGRIVAAGWVSDPVNVELNVDFGLARYETNGDPDPTFGSNGKVITDFSFTDYGLGVAIQPDCKIVAVGYSWHVQDDYGSDFALARYDGAGCLETTSSPCPLSHGHWKNNPNIWPVNSLMLGSQSYTKAEMLALLNGSTQTDASLILARQLIAAKLNVANGSDPTPVASTITHADGLLAGFSGKLPYKVKSSSATGQAMTADAGVLTNYNNGLLTPGCAP